MDRFSAAHLRATEFEREQLLKQRHWQRLVNQAKREQRAQELLEQKSSGQKTPRWTWGFRRISRFWGASRQKQVVN
jgi:hypothetical protein